MPTRMLRQQNVLRDIAEEHSLAVATACEN
jgi:hypothetical protein